VGAYVLTGMTGYTPSTIWNAMSSWWIADTVGILTITPLCLLSVRTFAPESLLGKASRAELSFHLTSLRGVATALVDLAGITVGVGAAFFLMEPGHFLFYICFLPLLWIALRNGLPRASIAVFLINLTAALAIQQRGTSADLLEFQFFMVALALTGLLVSVLVSERRRSVHILQSATARLNNRLDTVPTEPERATLASKPVDDRIAEHRKPLRDVTEVPPGLWRLSDILASSSDVLSRSADNMVALNDMLHESKVRLGKLISHDLKNPLVGIRGLAEVMNENDPPERFKRPLVLVERSAQQGLDLLDNLLTWSRLQTGHFAPSDQTHRLWTLAGEALAQLETQAVKKGVTIENNIGPGIVVHVDPFIVDTVLRNLVSNAIKFTPRGGYTSLTAYPAGEFIEVAVTDTGVGIAPEQLGSLFTIEQRTSTAGTEGENGTGLGLHICQELVEAEGGTIWVDSTQGAGTTFYFTLPTPPSRAPGENGSDRDMERREAVFSPDAVHDSFR
jgi:signal transduction histidine kinase